MKFFNSFLNDKEVGLARRSQPFLKLNVNGCLGETALPLRYLGRHNLLLFILSLQVFTIGKLSAEYSGFEKLSTYSYKKFMWFEVFTATLYVKSSSEFNYCGNLNFPLVLELKYNRKISKEQLIRSADKILRDIYDDAIMVSFKDELERINEFYQDVQAGDTYALEYIPGESLRLLRNGADVTRIESDEFAIFYLRIWLGSHSDSFEMAKTLLKIK